MFNSLNPISWSIILNIFIDPIKTNLFYEFNQKFNDIDKIFFKVNKTFLPKALVHSSKRVWSDIQKFS